MTRLAAIAADEIVQLQRVLPLATEVQWDRSTASRGERDETGRRASGGHSDPTADVATDPARLHVREVLTRGERLLAEAVVLLRGLRRGLERAMTDWEGPEDDESSTS